MHNSNPYTCTHSRLHTLVHPLAAPALLSSSTSSSFQPKTACGCKLVLWQLELLQLSLKHTLNLSELLMVASGGGTVVTQASPRPGQGVVVETRGRGIVKIAGGLEVSIISNNLCHTHRNTSTSSSTLWACWSSCHALWWLGTAAGGGRRRATPVAAGGERTAREVGLF